MLKFDIIVLIFYTIDIIFRLNIGFYENGKIVLNRRKVLRNYVRNDLFFDLIGTASMFIYIMTGIVETQYFFFIRIFRLSQGFTKFDNLIYSYGIASHTYTLFKLVLNIMTISHCLGVMYHIVNLIEIAYGEENSWLHITGQINKEWYDQYFESIYWAVSTLMLIGAKGETLAETIFTTTILFITVGVFGYLISSISQIIDDISRKTKEYKDDLKTINQYMKKKNISKELQVEVRSAIENTYQSKDQIDDIQNAHNIINKLPINISDDIKVQINLEMLNKFSQLTSFCSLSTLQKLAMKIEEKCYVTNQTFSSDSENCLYLITSGFIDLYTNVPHLKKKKIKTLKAGEILGDFEFFTNQNLNYMAISTTFTTMAQISRVEFLKILSQENNDMEKFKMIKDQLLDQGVSSIYETKCYLCNSMNHQASFCNQTNYWPNKYILVARHMHYEPQHTRVMHERRILRSHRAALYISLQMQWEGEDFLEELCDMMKERNTLCECCGENTLDMELQSMTEDEESQQSSDSKSMQSIFTVKSANEAIDECSNDNSSTTNVIKPQDSMSLINTNQELDQPQQQTQVQQQSMLLQQKRAKQSVLLEKSVANKLQRKSIMYIKGNGSKRMSGQNSQNQLEIMSLLQIQQRPSIASRKSRDVPSSIMKNQDMQGLFIIGIIDNFIQIW